MFFLQACIALVLGIIRIISFSAVTTRARPELKNLPISYFTKQALMGYHSQGVSDGGMKETLDICPVSWPLTKSILQYPSPHYR